MLLRDRVRQVWADAGVFDVKDARVRAFLDHVEANPTACFPEFAVEFRRAYYDLFDVLIPPLLAADDQELMLHLIKVADTRRRKEVATLRAFAAKADAKIHKVALEEIKRLKLRDPITKRTPTKRKPVAAGPARVSQKKSPAKKAR